MTSKRETYTVAPGEELKVGDVVGLDANGNLVKTIPDGYEMFEGKLTKVVNADRSGWWRYHERYDRDGYCDNPARGY